MTNQERSLQQALDDLPDWVHLEHSGFRMEPKPGVRDHLVWMVVVLLMVLWVYLALSGWWALLGVSPFVLATLCVMPSLSRDLFERRSIRATPQGLFFDTRLGPWLRTSVSLERHQLRVVGKVSDGQDGSDVVSSIELQTPDRSYELVLAQRGPSERDNIARQVDAVVRLLEAETTRVPDALKEKHREAMRAGLEDVRSRGRS